MRPQSQQHFDQCDQHGLPRAAKDEAQAKAGGQISTPNDFASRLFDILSFERDRRAFQNIGSDCFDLDGKVRPTKSFANCFRLGAREDFLKSQVVSKRFPFPARSQLGKGNGVVGVI
jgi:hypothetical protein